MTTKTLRAVIAARSRLRDVAAATEARARADHARADQTAAAAATELDRTIEQARDRLAEVTSIAGVMQLAEQIAGDRVTHEEAEALRAAADERLSRSGEELRRRARHLRTVERALDNLEGARAELAERDEQRMTDDLGPRRRSP